METNVGKVLKKKNLKYKEVATAIGVATSTVRRWASDENSRPNPTNSKLLSQYLGCDYLFIRGISNIPNYKKNPPCASASGKQSFSILSASFLDKGYSKGSLKQKKRLNAVVKNIIASMDEGTKLSFISAIEKKDKALYSQLCKGLTEKEIKALEAF